jgi:hypothetical protein
MKKAIDPSLPPRIVHLMGGLRAVDARDGRVSIQISANDPIAMFTAPPYPDVYPTIMSLGLQPVGVEFMRGGSFVGTAPPDWQCTSPSDGFQILAEQRAWQNIRTAAHNAKQPALANFASRAKSYLSLLQIRLFHLSEAYSRMLQFAGSIKPDQLFDNLWQPYLDAAIHAYLADSASFRDLIAEGVWSFLLTGGSPVTTVASFLKHAKESDDVLAQAIIDAGKPGGWIKVFTDLRNEVTHVAPVGRSSSLHLCQAKEVQCGPVKVLTLHYPLLASDGTIYRADETSLDFKDETQVRRQIDKYRVYCLNSIDGLTYAWETTARFVGLLSSLRYRAGFRQEEIAFTSADIRGGAKIVREES